MEPIRWKPFGLSVADLDRQLDELFDSVIESTWCGTAGLRQWRPQIDVYEGDDAYLVTADLPGVAPDDLTVEVAEDRVTICGERSAAASGSGERRVWAERWQGRFCREFAITEPVDVDRITISHTEGVYTIRLPKRERAPSD